MCAKNAHVTTRARRRKLFRLVGFAGSLSLLLSACRDNLPQSTLNPAGPEARQIDALFRPVFWIAVAVFVVVEGLIVFAAIRYRQRKGHEGNPVQTHGHTVLEVVWTLIPALILAVIAVPTVGTIFSLSRAEAGSDPLQVRVIGHQWWWEFEYPDLGVVTANELHVPTGRPIALTLTADEAPAPEGISDRQAFPVIHSFWIPRLAGKQDVIPGRENFMRFTADRPGDYLGQCAEYCGLSHANMKFRVIAETPEDFEGWVEAQKVTPPEAAPAGMEEGWELFNQGTCIGCHTVDGTQGGLVGPNLARFGSHRTLGAGMFKNTPENLARWIDDPRAMKPGAVMPDYGLTEDQIESLVEYLMSLR